MPAAAAFTATTHGQIIIGVTVSILGALLLGVLLRLWRLLGHLIGFTGDFIRDWRGEPARPGVAARPGVMERLEDQAVEITELRTQMSEVVGELPKNGVPLGKKIDALWTKYLDDTERARAALPAAVHPTE